MDIFVKQEKQYFNSSLVQVCTSTTEQFSFRTSSLKAEFQFEHCCMKEQTGDSRLASLSCILSSMQADPAGRIFAAVGSVGTLVSQPHQTPPKNQGKDLLR